MRSETLFWALILASSICFLLGVSIKNWIISLVSIIVLYISVILLVEHTLKKITNENKHLEKNNENEK